MLPALCSFGESFAGKHSLNHCQRTDFTESTSINQVWVSQQHAMFLSYKIPWVNEKGKVVVTYSIWEWSSPLQATACLDCPFRWSQFDFGFEPTTVATQVAQGPPRSQSKSSECLSLPAVVTPATSPEDCQTDKEGTFPGVTLPLANAVAQVIDSKKNAVLVL